MDDQVFLLKDGSRLEISGNFRTVLIVPKGRKISICIEDLQKIGFLLVLLDFWETHDADTRLRWFEQLIATLREIAEVGKDKTVHGV